MHRSATFQDIAKKHLIINSKPYEEVIIQLYDASCVLRCSLFLVNSKTFKINLEEMSRVNETICERN